MQNTNFATLYRTARLALAVSALTLLAAVSATAQSSRLVGWGNNSQGQLNFPADANRFVAVAAGDAFALGLRDDGTVEGWGNNSYGTCTPPTGLTGVVQISAAYYHSVALKSDGTVVCWGANYYDVLNVPSGLHNVVAVSAGRFCTLALLADGTVVGWGNGGSRVLPSGVTGTAISNGTFEQLILKADGTMVSYNNGTRDDWAPNLSGIASIGCGAWHGAAIRTDGTVAAWWQTVDKGQDQVPAGLSNVVALSAGFFFTMALKSDGTVACWGDNSSGQCNVPSDVAGVTCISAGESFSLALSVPPLDLTTSTPTFYSGSTATIKATVKFSSISASPRTVTFTSSDPSSVAAPAAVRIAAGATKATVVLSHMPVSTAKTVTITATSGDLSHEMPLTIQPIYVKKVTFDRNNSEGGIGFTGFVTLNTVTKYPYIVTLTGDLPSNLTVQSSAVVAASNTTALFSVYTSAVPANTTAHVTAQAGGAPFVAPLNIFAAPMVKDFKLSKSSIYGGQKTLGTVTLSVPAREDGMWVGIYIAGADCTGPASIFVPKGQTQGTVEITGLDIGYPSTTPISARTTFSEVVRPLTVNPMIVQTLSLSPATIRSGETSMVTVTLKDVVAVDTIVDILLVNSDVATVPATLTIPAGSKVGTVTLTANVTTTAKKVQVQGGRLGVFKSQRLVVNP